MTERYKDVELRALSDYITPDRFRTIDENMRSIPMGITEFAAEIQLKDKAKQKLSFKAPWDGIIYGCARDRRELKKMLGLESEIKIAYIVDWDDKFLFMLELEDSTEKAVAYVGSDDVIKLLEKCRKIPEQRISQRKD